MEALGSGVFLSEDTCPTDLLRNSCHLTPAEYGERDAIAAIRMVVSCLSIIGAVSIIASAVGKKQIWSAKVHPIFQLSVADFLLGVLWVVGGVLWFRGAPNRVWCFAISLPTVILQCVAVNLTLVFALVSYTSIRQKSVGNVMIHDPSYGARQQVWKPYQSFVVYLLSWTLPTILVMVVFGVLAGSTMVVKNANECSCWCYPHLGNVLPYSAPRDMPTARYVWHIIMLIEAYSVILLLNYLVVFVLLVIIYWLVLKHIRTIRDGYADLDSNSMHLLLQEGHSKAKKRILYYMIVFLVSGFANIVLCLLLVAFAAVKIGAGPVLDPESQFSVERVQPFFRLYLGLHFLQSLTVPLQGFLNAIVYGWTREDFLQAMGVETNKLKKEGEEELRISIGEASESDTDSDHTTSSDEVTRISPSSFDSHTHHLLEAEYSARDTRPPPQ